MYSLHNSAHLDAGLLEKIYHSFPLIHTGIFPFFNLFIEYELVDIDNHELVTKLGLSLQVVYYCCWYILGCGIT